MPASPRKSMSTGLAKESSVSKDISLCAPTRSRSPVVIHTQYSIGCKAELVLTDFLGLLQADVVHQEVEHLPAVCLELLDDLRAAAHRQATPPIVDRNLKHVLLLEALTANDFNKRVPNVPLRLILRAYVVDNHDAIVLDRLYRRVCVRKADLEEHTMRHVMAHLEKKVHVRALLERGDVLAVVSFASLHEGRIGEVLAELLKSLVHQFVQHSSNHAVIVKMARSPCAELEVGDLIWVPKGPERVPVSLCLRGRPAWHGCRNSAGGVLCF